jgi:hypothetical protein
VGVEDDAQEGAAAGEAGAGWIEHSAAVGQCRVVAEDGADASEDGVGGVTEALDLFSRFGAG